MVIKLKDSSDNRTLVCATCSIVIAYLRKEVNPQCDLLTWGLTFRHEMFRSFRESYDIAINKVISVYHLCNI